jgi:uncharacterized membrane protein YhiD involved in acid resistance
MDDFLTAFGPARILGAEQILLAMLLSFVLAFVIANVYRLTFQGLSYSRSFVHAQVLGAMIVSMLILAIGNNIARGLGILGTLAIIRFRTPIRDPRDMIFLFACFGIGIACGAGTYGVAVVGTLTITAAALLLHWSPFASRREYEGMLRFLLPPEPHEEPRIHRVLQECCASFQLIAMREAVQGDRIEYAYHVRLLDPSYQAELIEKLRGIGEVAEPNLLMHRTTIEL